MGKFLNPKDLKANLYRIFKEAEKEIIIISPFKQLLDEFKNHSKRI
jgi:sugar-specific transcriptional regulator TrmB